MRFTAITAATALMALTLSTALIAQRPDDQIDPRSVTLVQQGRAAQTAGNLDAATDALETALVVDPRNRAAYIALAEVARARGLHGKAIRLYREALALEPNDLAALRGQGEAMVQRGAMEKANETLTRMRTICGARCPDATQLAAVIQRGPPPAPRPSPTPTPVASQTPVPMPSPTPQP